MKLIVGLGNPGKEYDQTRHNLGFAVIDRLAQRWDVSLRKQKFNARVGHGLVADDRVMLMKPLTYMNLSGQSVLAAAQFHKLDCADDLLVVSDDLDLPFGRLRIRARGSSGGHKGLGDIQHRLGRSDFARLRVGIGRSTPPADAATGNPTRQAVDHVLSRFDADEAAVIEQAVDRAADAVESWIRQGTTATMNAFNRAEPENGA